MTLFEGWNHWVTNDSTLNARIGGVYPHHLPQSTKGTLLPAVCMTVKFISGASMPRTHESVSSWHRMRFTITIWEAVIKDSEQIISIIRGKLETFDGYLGGGSNVRFSVNEFAGPRSDWDPESRYYGIQLDVIAMVNLATVS